MSKGKRISQNERVAIVTLKNLGMNYAEIGRAIGRSDHAVANVCKESETAQMPVDNIGHDATITAMLGEIDRHLQSIGEELSIMNTVLCSIGELLSGGAKDV